MIPLKKIPYDLEAEKAVIASLIIDKEAHIKISETVRADHFYTETHQKIIDSILELYEDDLPVDLVTLNTSLKKKDLPQKVRTIYLNELVESIPTSANVEHYWKIVRDHSETRALIQICQEITESAYKDQKETSELIDWAESNIFKIAQDRIQESFLSIHPLLSSTLNQLESLYKQKGQLSGITSGFIDLDNLTGGFQRSDLIILAGRPSMGKTALCLNMVERTGLSNEDLGVAIFSLEMSNFQICQRFLSSHSGINSHRIRLGNFTHEEYKELTISASKISKARIFIDDSATLNPLALKAKLRRLIRREKIDIAFLDYLQLIQSDERRSENRQAEIAEISRSLKSLARELNIPIVALAQLSRSVEMRGGDHRPRLSDLRDSGAIEQDADLVLFIYREEYYDQDNPDAKNKAELILSKQRNGPTGSIPLIFDSKLARFDNFQKEG